VLHHLGMELVQQGSLEDAYDCMQEGLAIRRELGDTRDVRTIGDVGEILIRLGRFAEAQPYFQEGLKRVDGTEQYAQQNSCRLWLARLDWLRGQYADAASRLADLLARIDRAESAAQRHDLVFALLLGSNLALSRENLVEAADYCDQALHHA